MRKWLEKKAAKAEKMANDASMELKLLENIHLVSDFALIVGEDPNHPVLQEEARRAAEFINSYCKDDTDEMLTKEYTRLDRKHNVYVKLIALCDAFYAARRAVRLAKRK